MGKVERPGGERNPMCMSISSLDVRACMRASWGFPHLAVKWCELDLGECGREQEPAPRVGLVGDEELQRERLDLRAVKFVVGMRAWA